MVTKSARTRSGNTKRSKTTEDESAARQCDGATDAIVNDPGQTFSKEVQLLTTLECSDDETALLPALSSLEDFFINKLQSGEVVPTLKAAEAQGSANGKWLAETYLSFRETLKGLIGRRNVASTVQCPALNALMECARTEQPGTFSNELYGEMLQCAVTGDKLSSELVGVLVGRYLPFADVRYHTWSAIARIAEHQAKQHKHTQMKGKAYEGTATEASDEDIVRNLYDMMANIPLKFGDIDLEMCADAEERSGESAWCLPEKDAEVAAEVASDEDEAPAGKRKRG
eukprot:CAMPEP_0198209606 /NCGR_PEP_ID=MMETSP1445-20131203/17465_1 /TAXON_ID=36898 /ORGANISM="Pyramimonas sp., Strain CCMP2087" /LENGTH=284 /DNA_ID=CAMNT_0043883447 /DNA_START=193 /DNA_END=1043 /DNA_ORIENTATION=+